MLDGTVALFYDLALIAQTAALAREVTLQALESPVSEISVEY